MMSSIGYNAMLYIVIMKQCHTMSCHIMNLVQSNIVSYYVVRDEGIFVDRPYYVTAILRSTIHLVMQYNGV